MSNNIARSEKPAPSLMRTPRSLKEAIDNGLMTYYGECPVPLDLGQTLEEHLRDYLANRFAPAFLLDGADFYTRLWRVIIGYAETEQEEASHEPDPSKS